MKEPYSLLLFVLCILLATYVDLATANGLKNWVSKLLASNKQQNANNDDNGFQLSQLVHKMSAGLLRNVNDKCPVAADNDVCSPEITYWLFTRENRNGVQLDVNNLGKAKFLQKPLKFIIHGYWNNHTSPMVTVLKDGYLDKGEYNVVAADWGYYTKQGCYLQAKNSLNVVAGCVTKVFGAIRTHKNFGNIHILGHSLGAHMAARVSGHFIDPHIDRLTRFDPALPLFIDGTTNEGRAKFKDTYHSNAGILGQTPAQGDIDVYLNNGQFQPGCGCDLACSHMRSVLYFAESIKTDMWGFYCSKWDRFIKGRCKQPTKATLKKLGDQADQSQQGSFIIFGRKQSPFLYKKEDYLDPVKFISFRDSGKGECDHPMKNNLREYLN